MVYTRIAFLSMMLLELAVSQISINQDFGTKKDFLINEGHPGCVNELKLVLDEFGYTYDVRSSLTQIPEEQLVNDYCERYKNFIISNALFESKNILVAFTKNLCPKASLIISLTNRFDMGAESKENYEIINKLLKSPRVYWAPNNDYELEYMKTKGVFPPAERTFLAYPIGAVVDAREFEFFRSNMPKMRAGICKRTNFWNEGFRLRLENEPAFQKNVHVFDSGYGGPNILREKFEWIIYIPYCVSTMKVFENLQAGVVSVVPSPSILRDLVIEMSQKNVVEYNLPHMYQLMEVDHKDDWEQFFDIYNKRNS